MLGRTVREVTTELYQRWLTEGSRTLETQSSEQWLDDWLRLGGSVLREAPEGATATEVLADDRNRVDRR